MSWDSTGNWAPEEIATRGRATPALWDACVVLIGAGIFGSVIAELLMREGGAALAMLEGETLEAGNLVRHTLTVAEVGASEATVLAQRLNLASPHARVAGIDEEFPGPAHGLAALAEADVVIDSTGSDALLQQLSLHEWSDDKLIVSVSEGFFARRLFIFAARGARFPQEQLAAAINPWYSTTTWNSPSRCRGREPGAGIQFFPPAPATSQCLAAWCYVSWRQLSRCLKAGTRSM